MKYTLKPTPKHLCFVKKTAHGFDYAPEVGYPANVETFNVDPSLVLCTTKFHLADYVLSVLHRDVFLSDGDDHEGLRGVHITQEIHQSMKYRAMDYRLTGHQYGAVNDLLHTFYTATTANLRPFGYITPEELDDLAGRLGTVPQRRITRGDNDEKTATVTLTDHNGRYYAVGVFDMDKGEIPGAYYCIDTERGVGVPVLVKRSNFEDLFKDIPKVVQGLTVRLVALENDAKDQIFYTITFNDEYGDLLKWPISAPNAPKAMDSSLETSMNIEAFTPEGRLKTFTEVLKEAALKVYVRPSFLQKNRRSYVTPKH